MRIIYCFLILLLLSSCRRQITHTPVASTNNQVTGDSIRFSGYTWHVRDGKPGETQGPGPNNWSKRNVWLDKKGYLHLKINYDSATGKWYCAEVSMTQKLGFGTYEFWVEGAIDKFDKNIVLGLFNYSGRDGLDEMDIEYARWGNDSFPNLNYTVWPAKTGNGRNITWSKEVRLPNANTTQRFTRKENSVSFSSMQGFRSDTTNEFASHLFAPQQSADLISTLEMPVYINLWLFEGHPPTDNKAVEIIIHKFTYRKE